MSDETKQCIKCDEYKPLDAFNYQRNHCKECRNRYGFIRRNHPEVKQYDKAYRQRPEVKERKRQYNQLSKTKEANSEYRQRPEVKKQRGINHRNRKARKRSLPNTLTVIEWQNALNYFNGCCAVCERQLNDMFGEFNVHADHWIPLSYEGDDNPGTIATNIIPLCKRCNLSKNATMPEEWLKQNFSKRKAKKITARIQEYFDTL